MCIRDRFNPILQPQLPDSTFLCGQTNLTLDAGFFPNVIYNWSNGMTGQQIQIADAGIYWVEVTDSCGMIYDTVIVDPCLFYIPNVFTPNKDGNNDFFQLRGTGIAQFDMKIYDRWGKKVFETQSNGITLSGAEGWDGTINGKDANQGTYVYIILLVFDSGKEQTEQGNLTLVR
mgnify:CR=1 FL=1